MLECSGVWNGCSTDGSRSKSVPSSPSDKKHNKDKAAGSADNIAVPHSQLVLRDYCN